jgi:hypothetical protein
MKTISDAYLLEQIKLHENPNYGTASIQFSPMMAELISHLKPRTLTDYGAGKQNLKLALDRMNITGYDYQPYDPAFPHYGEPLQGDLVCCIDVLEHIEPDLLDNVLAHLAELIVKAGFFTVHTGPAGKKLSDGRNAHLIQQPTSWWLPRLCRFFEIGNLQTHGVYGGGFFVVVEPIPK